MPSLRRLVGRRSETVIDLTEKPVEDATGAADEQPGEADASTSAAPKRGADASNDEVAPVGASEGPGAERTSARWQSVLGWLLLSRDTAGRLTPVASIVLATGWLLTVVLLGTALAAMLFAATTDQPLFHAPLLVSGFRLAHGMPIQSADGAVSLVPMLPVMAVVLLLTRAALWVWWSVAAAERRAASRGAVGPSPLLGLAAFGGSYLVLATLVATSPTTGAADAPLLQGWGSLLTVVLLGTGAVWAWQVLRLKSPLGWLLVRAVCAVIVIVLALAFSLVLVRLLFTWSQFQEMGDALLASGAEPATRLDDVALGALQLAYLPNVVVWTAAYLVGAGFAVGVDTIVSPFSVTAGSVPELPLAALLPSDGLRWPWLPLVLVGLSSVLAGAGLRATGLVGRMRARVALGGIVAVGTATGLGVLAAAASGGLGGGRLAVMGPSPWLTLLWALVVIGLGQAAWAVFPTVVADVGPLVSNLAQRVRHMRWLPRSRARRAQRGASRRPRPGGKRTRRRRRRQRQEQP